MSMHLEMTRDRELMFARCLMGKLNRDFNLSKRSTGTVVEGVDYRPHCTATGASARAET